MLIWVLNPNTKRFRFKVKL